MLFKIDLIQSSRDDIDWMIINIFVYMLYR